MVGEIRRPKDVLGRLAVAIPLVLNGASGELDRRDVGTSLVAPGLSAFAWVFVGLGLASLVLAWKAIAAGRGGYALAGLALLVSAATVPFYSLGELALTILGRR